MTQATIQNGWKQTTLGEVATYVTKKANINEIDINNYISTENILADRLGITKASSLPAVSKVNAFKKDDILFSNIRTYFKKVWHAKFHGGASNDVLIFRPIDENDLDKKFLYYLISSDKFINFTVITSKGTKMPRGDKDAIKGFSISLPSLPEQKAIAHILGSLDDKIELNRRMNETLEAMAQALFKDWFVDFGPTRAKAEGRAPYLTSEIWDIFPDAFDDKDKPVGWQIGSIGDLADTNHQSWTARNHPAAVEYVDLSNAKWGNIDAVTAFAWKDAPSRARRVARMGDTIVGTTRPGNGSFVYISQNGLTVSTGFAVLSPREVIYQDVVYIAATRLDNIERLANLADSHGGAYPAVKPKDVSDTELVLPGDAVLSAFADLVSPLRAKIENVKVESRALSQTRDLLLPKLMSGEIRLREAERVVEAVV